MANEKPCRERVSISDAVTHPVMELKSEPIEKALRVLVDNGWPLARLRITTEHCHGSKLDRRAIQADGVDVFEVLTRCPQGGAPCVVVSETWLVPAAPPSS